MHRFFGKAKEKVPGPTLDDASSNMDVRGEEMDKKIHDLDVKLVDLKKRLKQTKAPAAQRSLKQKAMQLLKQKKMYEKQRGHLYNQQFNVDQTKYAIQGAKDNASTYEAMKGAKKELKTAFKGVDLDKIEDLNDEMSDLLELGDEMNEIMGQTYGVPEDLDEDELLDELDALDDELELDDEVPAYLQEAQATVPCTEEKDEEVDELGLPRAVNKVQL